MTDYQTRIEQARPGQIIPMVREIELSCPVEFFSRLSDYGRAKHCCLLESRDYLSESKGNELTFGTASPALYLTGKGDAFEIRALSPVGRRMLRYLSEHPQRFEFCREIRFEEETVTGSIRRTEKVLDEQSRL